jgi:hypothetical protein
MTEYWFHISATRLTLLDARFDLSELCSLADRMSAIRLVISKRSLAGKYSLSVSFHFGEGNHRLKSLPLSCAGERAAAVDLISPAGDPRSFLGGQIENQLGYFLWIAHTSERMGSL